MSYLALARKWRPHTFGDLVGQRHVVQSLSNALDNNRVHHAYLFTGTRGIGKTTIARIFAKSLNCLTNGVSSSPCGKCEACVSVDEGRFVDLIEIDAASNTKVDDTREILDNVQYAPTYGRYKIYLIDEVHMLSTHSFNALLKTLEEPPEHVKFILATTDPQKLPVTILSRCLQFFLKPLTLTEIVERLAFVLTQEDITHEIDALKLIARAGQGSMRDSLSLLDQAIVYSGDVIKADDVRDMLGLIEHRYVQDILSAIIHHDFSRMMEVVAVIHQKSPDYSAIFDELLSAFHHLSILQFLPEIDEETIEGKAWLSEFLTQVDKSSLQLYYQIVLKGKQDLLLAPDVKVGFEMVLLRLFAFKPVMNADELTVVAKANSQAIGNSENNSPSAEKKTEKFDPIDETQAQTSSLIATDDNSAMDLSDNDDASSPSHDKTHEQDNDDESAINQPIIEPSSDQAISLAEDSSVNLPSNKKTDNLSSSSPFASKTAIIDDSFGLNAEPYEEDLDKQSSQKGDIEHSVNAEKDVTPVLTEVALPLTQENWLPILEKLSLNKMVKELFMDCVMFAYEAPMLSLSIAQSKRDWFSDKYVSQFIDAITEYHGQPIKIDLQTRQDADQLQSPREKKEHDKRMQLQYAENVLREDESIKYLEKHYGAKIMPKSIQLIENTVD